MLLGEAMPPHMPPHLERALICRNKLDTVPDIGVSATKLVMISDICDVSLRCTVRTSISYNSKRAPVSVLLFFFLSSAYHSLN